MSSARTCSPYLSSLAGPTPGTPASRRRSAGTVSAIATSVASVKTTYAGTFASAAVRERHSRRRSKSASSYVGGQVPQRPTLRSAPVVSGAAQVRQVAGADAFCRRRRSPAPSAPRGRRVARRRCRAGRRGSARRPVAATAGPRAGPRQVQVLPGPGHADVEQAALFFDRLPALGQRDRHQPLGQADEEHRVPLQALGRVQRREGDALHGRARAGRRCAPRARRRTARARRRAPAWPGRRPGRRALAGTPTGRGRRRAPAGGCSDHPSVARTSRTAVGSARARRRPRPPAAPHRAAAGSRRAPPCG